MMSDVPSDEHMTHPLPILNPTPGGLSPRPRKPAWLKMKMPAGEGYSRLLNLVNDQRLHTVCQSAKCPNMGECWSAGNGHAHDPRRRLHAIVPVLQYRDRPPRQCSTATSRRAWGPPSPR